MSDAQQIAERFVQIAFDGDDPSPELIVQMTDEFLDAGLREAVEALERIIYSHKGEYGGTCRDVQEAEAALAALKGGTITNSKEATP